MSVWVKFTDNQAALVQSEFRNMYECGAGFAWQQIANKVNRALLAKQIDAAMKAEKREVV